MRNLETQDISKLVTSPWQDHSEELKKVFLPQQSFDISRNEIIRNTVFVDARSESLTKDIAFPEKMLPPKKLRESSEEDYVGRPNICNSKYFTSHNSIHHLHHLICFQNKAEVTLDEYNSVLE